MTVARSKYGKPASSVYSDSPLYVATLTRGHPSYEATILENTPCMIVSDELTRGHPSNKARFSIPQGWPYQRGTTVYSLKLNQTLNQQA